MNAAQTLIADLFPETLLVERRGDHIFTTSVKVAQFFKKSHRNVMRDIKKLLADIESQPPNLAVEIEFSMLNFEQSNYISERGRTYNMYLLSHDGFALLAMGFSGADALGWKIKFLQAFRLMEAQLAERKNQIEKTLRVVRPNLLPVVEGTEAGLSRNAIAAPLGKKCGSVTYHRNQARRFGLLPVKKGGTA